MSKIYVWKSSRYQYWEADHWCGNDEWREYTATYEAMLDKVRAHIAEHQMAVKLKDQGAYTITPKIIDGYDFGLYEFHCTWCGGSKGLYITPETARRSVLKHMREVHA